MANQIQVVQQPSAKEITQVSDPLLRIKAVFPFQLFPGELIVDRFKIDMIERDFLAVEKVTTLPFTGTLTVNITKGPFFASVSAHDPATGNKVGGTYFNPNDAARFRQLVQGLVVGINQGIPFTTMETDKVIATAMNLGAIEKPGGGVVSAPM